MNPTETGRSSVSLTRSYRHFFGARYELRPGPPDTPLWWVMKDGVKHRDFTSLAAAKGWLEHVERNGE